MFRNDIWQLWDYLQIKFPNVDLTKKYEIYSKQIKEDHTENIFKELEISEAKKKNSSIIVKADQVKNHFKNRQPLRSTKKHAMTSVLLNALHNTLPTNSNLFKWYKVSDGLCELCNE